MMVCIRRSPSTLYTYLVHHTPHNVLIEETMYAICCQCGATEQASFEFIMHQGPCGNYFNGKTMDDLKKLVVNTGENSESQHSFLVNTAKDSINAVVRDKNVTLDHTLASLVALREILNSAMDALEAAPQ